MCVALANYTPTQSQRRMRRVCLRTKWRHGSMPVATTKPHQHTPPVQRAARRCFGCGHSRGDQASDPRDAGGASHLQRQWPGSQCGLLCRRCTCRRAPASAYRLCAARASIWQHAAAAAARLAGGRVSGAGNIPCPVVAVAHCSTAATAVCAVVDAANDTTPVTANTEL